MPVLPGTKIGPVKLTDEVLRKLEEAAAMDATWDECALFANVSVSSLYLWLKEEPGLRERLEELRNKPFLKARSTLMKSLDETDGAQWYMERKKKKEFGKNMDVTSDGNELKGIVYLPQK